MTAFYWLTAAASLLGVWLNIHRHVACFWIWAATNATWAYADAAHGLAPQAVVQAIYFALSIYGIARWGRDGGRSSGQQHPGEADPR